MCSWGVTSPCPTRDTSYVTVKRHEHNLKWKSCWTPVCANKIHITQIKHEPLQNKWESRRIEYRFYTKIVADITTCI